MTAHNVYIINLIKKFTIIYKFKIIFLFVHLIVLKKEQRNMEFLI